MNSNLASLLPLLLPSAIAWAESQERRVLAEGMPLTVRGQELARSVGVGMPERIRVLVVSSLPLPDDPQLQAVALETGLLGPGMVGLTLGHGVFICRGHDMSRGLLSHELRHVHQYEAHGSIAQFLSVYLAQIAQYGYDNAPLEADARAHERSAP
jgi:hypothetical protein